MLTTHSMLLARFGRSQWKRLVTTKRICGRCGSADEARGNGTTGTVMKVPTDVGSQRA